mgnify:CR=1 FL=1
MTETYPEKGEVVLGTVKEIFGQGAFITLDEYGRKKGMLHISEISLKWVRNIRDYVKEGQKTVVQVLDVRPDRGHIDLSLRRVSDAQRKQKLQQVKQMQRADKLLQLIAKELGEDPKSFSEKISGKLLKEYESVYDALEAMTVDDTVVEHTELKAGDKKVFQEMVRKSISPPNVTITGYLDLETQAPDGVSVIKETLSEVTGHTPKNCELEVSYVSAPVYRINITAPDYKQAEQVFKNSTSQAIKYISGKNGEGEAYRDLKK